MLRASPRRRRGRIAARPWPPSPNVTRNTINKFAVAGQGKEIVILNLPIVAALREGGDMPAWPTPAPLTKGEALNLAAWLVAITGERAA